MVYLDNAATTMIDPDVVEAMMPYMKHMYGNPGSLHSFGRDCLQAVSKAREEVAKTINADAEQIVFTSGGTEANNTVMKNTLVSPERYKVLYSAVEHDSVINPLVNDYYPPDSAFAIPVTKHGIVDLEELKKMMSDKVALVSVMYVNNETGAVNPVKEIAELCKEYGALLHIDCVQALGTKHIDVKAIGCDFASFSSHKIHGPKGIGALYIKHKTAISPLIHGGKYQEFGLRGGTENVAGCVGFGKACEIIRHGTPVDYNKLGTKFLTVLDSELRHLKCDVNYRMNATKYNDHRKIISLTFDGVDAESLVLMMDSAAQVCISAGSACSSHNLTPSHVLKAMGMTDEEAFNTVRIKDVICC